MHTWFESIDVLLVYCVGLPWHMHGRVKWLGRIPVLKICIHLMQSWIIHVIDMIQYRKHGLLHNFMFFIVLLDIPMIWTILIFPWYLLHVSVEDIALYWYNVEGLGSTQACQADFHWILLEPKVLIFMISAHNLLSQTSERFMQYKNIQEIICLKVINDNLTMLFSRYRVYMYCVCCIM
jgi:hypothetical protein